MTFYIVFYRVFEKTRFVLFMFCEPLSSKTPNCGVKVSLLLRLVYAKRYFISQYGPWESLRISSLSFSPIHSMGYMGIIRINIFPESFCWRVLARLCRSGVGRVLSLLHLAGDTLRPRFFTEKTRAKNQNVRFA